MRIGIRPGAAARRGKRSQPGGASAGRPLAIAALLLIGGPLLWLAASRLRAQQTEVPLFVQQTEQLGASAVDSIEKAEDWTEEREAAAWDAMGKARSETEKMREAIAHMEDGPQLSTTTSNAGMAEVDGPAMRQVMDGMHQLYMTKQNKDGTEAADEMMVEMKAAMQQRVQAWSNQLDAMEAAMQAKQAQPSSP